MPDKKRTLIKIAVAALIAALGAVGVGLDVPDKVIDTLSGFGAETVAEAPATQP
jgi:hypothetical protein